MMEMLDCQADESDCRVAIPRNVAGITLPTVMKAYVPLSILHRAPPGFNVNDHSLTFDQWFSRW